MGKLLGEEYPALTRLSHGEIKCFGVILTSRGKLRLFKITKLFHIWRILIENTVSAEIEKKNSENVLRVSGNIIVYNLNLCTYSVFYEVSSFAIYCNVLNKYKRRNLNFSGHDSTPVT